MKIYDVYRMLKKSLELHEWSGSFRGFIWYKLAIFCLGRIRVKDFDATYPDCFDCEKRKVTTYD